jgi:RNA ligase (TIGR02306 family)
MSTVFVELTVVDDVRPHPNADKLEIVVIRGVTTIAGKGEFSKGQRVVYFPPDILLPPDMSLMLGVQKYLKHAEWPGDSSHPVGKCQCRVAGCRLRGEPSYGFIIPAPSILDNHAIGSDVSVMWAAQKYEPPVRYFYGDLAPEDNRFHKYTDIEHYWRFNEAIAEGTLVRITEKIHGTNSRVGLVMKNGGFEFMAGSHRTRRKKPEGESTSIYWRPLEDEGILNLLSHLCDEQNSVIVFGEIYGAGIQDMDYGAKDGYRVFDISVNGKYLDWDAVKDSCRMFDVEMVPVLYEGPFTNDLVKQFTYGPTTLAEPGQIKSSFKDREGCVITPQIEQPYAPTGGRLILKSVSADYLDRKGAQDNE